MTAHCKFCRWTSGPLPSIEVCAAARNHLLDQHPDKVALLRKRERQIEDLIAKTERQFGDAYRPC